MQKYIGWLYNCYKFIEFDKHVPMIRSMYLMFCILTLVFLSTIPEFATAEVNTNKFTLLRVIEFKDIFSLIRTPIKYLPSNINCKSTKIELPGSWIDCKIKNEENRDIDLSFSSVDGGITISGVMVNLDSLPSKNKVYEYFNLFTNRVLVGVIKTTYEPSKTDQLKYDWSTSDKKFINYAGEDQEYQYRIDVTGGYTLIQINEKWTGITVKDTYTKQDTRISYLVGSEINKQIVFANLAAKTGACDKRQLCFDKQARFRIYKDAQIAVNKEYVKYKNVINKLSDKNRQSYSTFIMYISNFESFVNIMEPLFMDNNYIKIKN